MSIFGEALATARAKEPARQARELEQHLRTYGLAEVESLSGCLHVKRSFPKVSPQQFEGIVQRLREQRSRARRTR